MVGLLFLPLLEAAAGWLRVLVGLLFEIWIVDASIFVVCCRQRGRAVPVLRLLPPFVCCCGVGRVFLWFCFVHRLIWCVCSVCCFDVVETSYEGHMVDALASRADEGRSSLR